MNDFGVEECEASVQAMTAIYERVDIVLDATCFYPRGGGQDWDMGKISNADATFEVEEVRLDEDGTVHHIGSYENGSFDVGTPVACIVDHVRREVNTRLHSAGHVIDMAIDRVGLDWVAVKGQHYPHLSAVEYEGTWDPDRYETLQTDIERVANEIIATNTENRLLFMPVEEMETVVRHVPANIPRNKPARVVMYGDDFGIPCGGTHVKNLGTIGSVAVPKIKMKKGIIRVNYSVAGIN